MSGKYNSLGAGWNTFEQSKRNEVLNLEIRELNPNTETAIHICNSSEEVNQKLEVSGSLGVEATTAKF
jgi:methionine synthase II (cobalamin-independent)